MLDLEKVTENSDSLVGLLTAQCSDLEKLLALAREETTAAEHKNFEKIMEIVSERAKVSERLETFQSQISELRGRLEEQTAIYKSKVLAKISELAAQTLEQDSITRKLLISAKTEANAELQKLETNQRGTNAYMKNDQRGMAYDIVC